ncbi:MAG: alpha/beta fold hydrolase [Beduini sp.]|uniref:alpha/beta fold hydrolase n=1 Tax=Beduini sp. TaxID=1922300 RepID=UPI0039A02E2D
MAFFNYLGKNVYYEETGSGKPLILLHGNSVSSKMFTGIIDLYKQDFKVILIDFLGHGNSERLEKFPTDFWYDEAMQVIELINCRQYDKVNIIGTSGGALAALNVALKRPDLVDKVIADSFEGEESLEAWTQSLYTERESAKGQEKVCMLWEYCHGKDWESVVDQDTEVILRHAKEIKQFFHQDLSSLTLPIMLTVSLKDDEYINRMNIEKVYKQLAFKIPNSQLHLFPSGGHPAMLTNAEIFFETAKRFIKS